MLQDLKRIVRLTLGARLLYGVLKWRYNIRKSIGLPTAFLAEEQVTSRILDKLKPKNRFYVDIGASDGITNSNTYHLITEGWPGISIECDDGRYSLLCLVAEAFPEVRTVKALANADCIGGLLNDLHCPQEPAFVNIDIDSFDYYVLEAVLLSFRPALVCVEINERIPPPLHFRINKNCRPELIGGPFYGMSIQACYDLAIAHNYGIVELHYNNLYLAPLEHRNFQPRNTIDAYQEGWLDKRSRTTQFYWNAPYEYLLNLPQADVRSAVSELFKGCSDSYVLR